ncbi:hypothetical protein [Kitasatospora sp. NPDC001132]
MQDHRARRGEVRVVGPGEVRLGVLPVPAVGGAGDPPAVVEHHHAGAVHRPGEQQVQGAVGGAGSVFGVGPGAGP